jgi:type IV secretion system protein VirB6
MFGISLLVWSLMIIDGKIQSPMNDWILKGLYMLLVLTAAGSMYSTWISGPLFKLPYELTNAIGGGTTSTTSLDRLSESLGALISGIAQAMVTAFKEVNFGGAAVLLISMVAVAIAGTLLEVACVFNLIYAKIGLALVLGVGPFFILCLFWSHTKNWFYSWMNTVFYFVFLSVITTMVMVIFINIANEFMSKLMGAVSAMPAASSGLPGVAGAISNITPAGQIANVLTSMMSAGGGGASTQAAFNILTISFQMVLVFLPMFLVALEIRTLVASMTGGSGSSAGGGIMAAIAMKNSAKGKT